MTEQVLKRLESGALTELVDLAADYVLDQPLHALVDVDWLSGRIVHALDTWSNSDQTEIWIRQRIAALRESSPEGLLRDHLPEEVSRPLHDVVQRPFVPDQAIIERLLGHKAVEAMVRELLVGTLQSFAQRFKPSVPGSQRLRSLKRMGDGVLGGIGQAIEGHAEGRVRDFVDAMMAQVMDQIVDHLCNPTHAEVFGRFRGHLFEEFLDTPMSDLDRELDKLNPDDLVRTGTAIARSLAAREGLQSEMQSILEAVLNEAGDATLREHLAEAGIEDEWHSEVRGKLAESAQEFIRKPGFQDWLTGLLSTDPSG